MTLNTPAPQPPLAHIEAPSAAGNTHVVNETACAGILLESLFVVAVIIDVVRALFLAV